MVRLTPTKPALIVIAFAIVSVVGGGWFWIRPLSPRPFDAIAWRADRADGYTRYAMSADLAQRMVAQHWDKARVLRETGANRSDGRGIGIGMRSPIDGPYYLRVDYDADDCVVSATVLPS